jgi:hypothetical protein
MVLDIIEFVIDFVEEGDHAGDLPDRERAAMAVRQGLRWAPAVGARASRWRGFGIGVQTSR